MLLRIFKRYSNKYNSIKHIAKLVFSIELKNYRICVSDVEKNVEEETRHAPFTLAVNHLQIMNMDT